MSPPLSFRCYVIPADSGIPCHEVVISTKKSLQRLQELVAVGSGDQRGHIEMVPLHKDPDANGVYVNEDGIALGLPFNKRATLLVDHFIPDFTDQDWIKGDAVVAGPPDNQLSVTPAMLDYLRTHIK